MRWLPEWLGNTYTILFLKHEEGPFSFEEASKVLNFPSSRVRVALSELKRRGLLAIFARRGRHRLYRLLDISTWCKLRAFGVKNLERVHGRYLHLLAKLLKALIERYGENVVSVVLYGSVARGEVSNYSDVDLLLVCNFEGSIGRRIAELVELRYHPLVRQEELWLRKNGIYTRPSFYPLNRGEAPYFRLLYLDMVEDAIILYDKGDFFYFILQRVKERLSKIGARKIMMSKRKWYWILEPTALQIRSRI